MRTKCLRAGSLAVGTTERLPHVLAKGPHKLGQMGAGWGGSEARCAETELTLHPRNLVLHTSIAKPQGERVPSHSSGSSVPVPRYTSLYVPDRHYQGVGSTVYTPSGGVRSPAILGYIGTAPIAGAPHLRIAHTLNVVHRVRFPRQRFVDHPGA